jgi:hypothetical protein
VSGALFNAKRSPRVGGAIYEVKVSAQPDGLSIVTSPTYVEGPNPDDTGVAQLEAEDRTAATADQLRKQG